MNNLLIIVVVIVVAYCYFGGTNCPSVLRENKEMLLGVFVGLVLCSFMGVKLEGMITCSPGTDGNSCKSELSTILDGEGSCYKVNGVEVAALRRDSGDSYRSGMIIDEHAFDGNRVPRRGCGEGTEKEKDARCSQTLSEQLNLSYIEGINTVCARMGDNESCARPIIEANDDCIADALVGPPRPPPGPGH